MNINLQLKLLEAFMDDFLIFIRGFKLLRKKWSISAYQIVCNIVSFFTTKFLLFYPSTSDKAE